MLGKAASYDPFTLESSQTMSESKSSGGQGFDLVADSGPAGLTRDGGEESVASPHEDEDSDSLLDMIAHDQLNYSRSSVTPQASFKPRPSPAVAKRTTLQPDLAASIIQTSWRKNRQAGRPRVAAPVAVRSSRK